MAYSFAAGNGLDEDIHVILDIGSGASNPRIKYDSATGEIQASNDGSTYFGLGAGGSGPWGSVTWDAPGRWGDIRIWPDVTNQVPRWKWGSDPSDEQDGNEFAGFQTFER